MSGVIRKIKTDYGHTIYASYVGYITQAIVNNFVPLLFLTFQSQYDISLEMLGLLVTINFGVQLFVDFIAAKFIDKIGYRIAIVAAHIFAGAGLIGLAVFPELLPPYAGIVLAIIFYAIGGGILEVLVSPIVEACPTTKKEAAMSLLHSFYCWGHVFVVLASTLFFTLAGIGNWKWMAILWAIVPFANAVYFSLVPLASPVEEGKGMTITELFKNKTFWILFLLMICSGASEQGMSQWASAFAESGLKVSKTVGDLAGPCLFAVLMGTSRALYAKLSDKISLKAAMVGSGCLCMVCYLLAAFAPHPVVGLIGCAVCGFSVGIMWPGTFSLASNSLPAGGTAMFAFLALAGDLGCGSGPTIVGAVAERFGDDLKIGVLSAIVFPVLLVVVNLLLKSKKAA
ncbi:MAG: MFS transporter [Lachnospiraceae bacterium]|nr:MFS transporter [Lachnospiraceae bacterium]MBP3568617.1 MFS transporter [Lachnospiraceae bacterium]